MTDPTVVTRAALPGDVPALDVLERASFATDRLSRRRFAHWVQAQNAVLLVAELDGRVAGYGLVLLHRGTRLARLYSLAVAGQARGYGLGRILLEALEKHAADRGRLFMRLEVARDNQAAVALYQSLGYSTFGVYNDYYQDHQDALRMQKRIRYVSANLIRRPAPWYQQTTPFTCGPAALMMAMASLDPAIPMEQTLELDIWREATTIFMTRGHGGCHPVGLALAAKRRGFATEVWLNRHTPLFIEGVRDVGKKNILAVVDGQFRDRAQQQGVPLHYRDVSQDDIARWLDEGAAVLVLISTYRMDSRKAPHWVMISAIDEECLYVHDPDPGDDQNELDCRYLPIARADFSRMSLFGKEKLQTAVVVRKALADL